MNHVVYLLQQVWQTMQVQIYYQVQNLRLLKPLINNENNFTKLIINYAFVQGWHETQNNNDDTQSKLVTIQNVIGPISNEIVNQF